jgi:hypothetical protein
MIVGEAHVIVRAITDNVKRDITAAFKDAGGIGGAAGAVAGEEFAEGFGKSLGGRGGGPLGNALNGMQSATEAARRQFDALIVSSYTLGPAILQLVAGISSLIGALGALAGMAAGAVPALGALGGAFGALLQGMGTLKLAMSGVSEAISAGQKAAVATGGATKAAEKDLTNFVRRVKDARRQLTRVIEENADRIYEASMRIIDAENDIARTARDNAETVAESKLKVQQAQEKLNQAYKEGLEQIQQLGFDSEDAALNEKRAAFELDKARQTLLRTQDLPPNSNARRAAELAYAQADLNYRKAADTNKDMAAEKKRLDETGVEGTKGVIDAQNDLAKANYELAKDEREAEEDRLDGIKKIMDLYADQIKVQEENDRRLADAQRNLKRAENDLEKARKDSGAAGVAATNAYAAAMNKLSPEAQTFVRFMVDEFIPSIDKLKAAAGREFFPKLITAMTDIKDRLFPALVPLLETTGGKLGDIAIKIGDAITSDKALGQIERIWTNNDTVIEHFGNVAKSAISIVLRLLEAVGPLTERFAGWLDASAKKFDKFLNKDTKLKDLKDFFNQAGDIAAKFGDIFGNIFTAVGNIVLGLMKPGSGGWQLLHFFEVMTQKFSDWTGSAEGSNKIAGYFKDVAQNAIAIMKATGPFVALFLKLGADPSVGDFANRMKDLAPTVESIASKFLAAGPALADFLRSALTFIDLTTDSGAIQKFWEVLQGVADALVTLFSNPTIQKGFILFAELAATLVALRTAWKFLQIPILAVVNPLAQLSGAIVPLIPGIQRITAPMKSFMGIFAKEGLPALTLLPVALKDMAAGLLALSGPVLLVAAAVAGLVAIFVAMWNESEVFRKAIKDLVDNTIAKAVEIFEELKLKLEEALEPLGGMEGVLNILKGAFKILGDYVGTYIIPIIGGGLTSAFEMIGAVIGLVIDLFGNFLRTVKRIFTAIRTGNYGDIFGAIWDGILGGLSALGEAVWTMITAIFENLVNIVKTVLGIASPSTVFMEIGQAIVDGLMNAIGALLGLIQTVFQGIFDWAKSIPGTLTGLLVKSWDGLIAALATAWLKVKEWFGPGGKVATYLTNLPNTIKNYLVDVWKGLITLLASAWLKVEEFFGPGGKVPLYIATLYLKLKGYLAGVWDGLADRLTDALVAVKTWFSGTGPLASFIKGLGMTIKGWASGMWDGLKTGLGGVVKWIQDRVGNLVDIINIGISGANLLGADLDPLTKPQFYIPMAKGGVVPARSGGTLALIGEAGRPERVEPLDDQGLSQRDRAIITMLSGGGGGGGGINIQVYAAPEMDVQELSAIVGRELAFQMRRGAA